MLVPNEAQKVKLGDLPTLTTCVSKSMRTALGAPNRFSDRSPPPF